MEAETGDVGPCGRCHPLDGREEGRPVAAGCVHEHLTTIFLCPRHEKKMRTLTSYGLMFCKRCKDAGVDHVSVAIITPAIA